MKTDWKVGDGFEDLHDLPPAKAEAGDGLENVTLYKEDCKSCGGSGRWQNRAGYKCFACKGRGYMEFKTSSAVRKVAAKSRVKRLEKKASDSLQNWAKYLKSHVSVAEWLEHSDSEFATSLTTSGAKYGSLTEGQERAVYKCVASDQDGLETFKANTPKHIMEWLVAKQDNEPFAKSLYDAGVRYGSLSDKQMATVERNIKLDTGDDDLVIDLHELATGYYAVPDGETRLKIAIRRPKKNSRWFGWIFVDDGAEYGARKNYGRQGPDAMYTGLIQEQLKAVLADPLEALQAYGRLTGSCGVCGRVLEDEESVARGIGPICWGKL